MTGGNVPPIPSNEGGGGREYGYQSIDEQSERRKKRILMQDEQILEIIKIWVQEND